ncbi:Syntaxin-72 [Diplonema papillatum]|nr:Syntaxin-72 [Diplonema papillatum]
MADSNDVARYIRRLEKLATNMGIHIEGAEQEEEEVDTSNMTKYEKNRYQVAKSMSKIRDDLQTIEDIEKGKTGATATRKAQVTNRLRKSMREMKVDAAGLKKDAANEGKLHEYDEIIKHMKRTEKLYAARFRPRDQGSTDEDRSSAFDGGGGGAIPMKSIDQIGDSNDLSEGLIDPAEDEEFQQFFLETRQNDQKIDEGLDRIHASVGRLKVHAQNMGDELEKQNVMLDQANEKASDLTHKVQNLNKKLTKTLKEVEKDKYCCYLICCLLILGILGVIVTQVT